MEKLFKLEAPVRVAADNVTDAVWLLLSECWRLPSVRPTMTQLSKALDSCELWRDKVFEEETFRSIVHTEQWQV